MPKFQRLLSLPDLLPVVVGDPAALGQYWNANIFYPAPLTLAYSEHLTPQMLMALPILATTGNIALAYNVLFLSTIVLSGLGMYLLVRELSNQPPLSRFSLSATRRRCSGLPFSAEALSGTVTGTTTG